MLGELNEAIAAYHTKWHELINDCQDKAFFQALKPTAIAWKTTDLADFDKRFAELRAGCDQIHLGWVNDRWLATLHLKDGTLDCGVTLVKLMQRRPGSADATGLDHLDFLVPSDIDTKAILGQETKLKWSEEKNGEHCKWLSIWFSGTEAKLRSDTVVDVCITELQHIRSQLQLP